MQKTKTSERVKHDLSETLRNRNANTNIEFYNFLVYCPTNSVIDDTIKYNVYSLSKTKLLPNSKYIHTSLKSDIQTYPPNNLSLITQN